MSIVIESPKLLSIRITQLSPLDNKHNYVYTYQATLDVTAQLHSGTNGMVPAQFDARDINVGDYVATTSRGRVLKIQSIQNAGPTRIECILVDEDQINSASDETQFGESAIDKDDGILFELREGKPYLFPLPDILPGGLTKEFAIQILSRFNFTSKDKNIVVEQAGHGFILGETLALTSTGWQATNNDPTGVVVKKDEDTFSVRLFGTKTYLELPGDIGSVYYWDNTDRMLTATASANTGNKLFQKLDSREALLLNGGSIPSDVSSGPHFSGNYNDLTNKPAIPTDVSNLSDNNGLLNHPIEGLATETYVDDAIASVNGFSGDYNDLTNTPTLFDGDYDSLSNKPTLFDGNYNLLVNKPTIPDKTSDLNNDSGYITSVTMSHVLTALGYTPADAANVFNGDYNSLANLPVLNDYITNSDLSNFRTESQILNLINSSISNGIDLDYNELLNKPSIPSDVSQLTDTTNLLERFTGNYNDLSNKPDLSEFITETEIDSKIASAVTGGTVDLSDYVTDSELATAIANLGSGGNVDLSDYYTKTQVDALIPTTFSGDYNDLTNKPTIPDITGLASETYVQTQIAQAALGGGVDLSTYVTDSELATQLANYQPTIDLSSYYNKTQVDALIPTVPSDISQLTDTTNLLSGGGGSTDLTGYATETFVNQQVAAASIGGIANLDDLSDVAVGSLPQSANASEHYLLEYNPITSLWESNDFGSIFATQSYVSATVATALTDGDINLDGYATEQFVEQKLVERGNHFSGNYFDLANRPQLFSGSYLDLTNVPTRKEYTLTSNGSSLSLIETEADPDQVVATIDFADLGIGFSGDYSDLTNRPSLFSGNYDDLNNKPYIPSIAGLATEAYVDNRWAEPTITGDRFYTDDIEYQATVNQKTSIVSHVANKRDLVIAIQTTDATEVEALLEGGTPIAIEDDTTAKFSVTYVATSGTDHASFVVSGIISRTGGNITLIGNNNTIITADSGTSWTGSIVANATNNSLKINVQGTANNTVDWTIFVEIIEVIR